MLNIPFEHNVQRLAMSHTISVHELVQAENDSRFKKMMEQYVANNMAELIGQEIVQSKSDGIISEVNEFGETRRACFIVATEKEFKDFLIHFKQAVLAGKV